MKALESVPKDMESAYNEVLDRIDKANGKETARQIFSWIYHEQRPLHMDELQEVLSIETRPPDAKLIPKYFLSPVLIIQYCQSLVEFDKNSGIVRFTHYTFEEFLKDKYQDKLLSSVELAKVCLTYLTFDIFELGPCPDKESFDGRMKTHRFSDYGVRYWGCYMRGKGEEDHEALNILFKLFRSSQKRAALRQHQLFIQRPWDSEIWKLSVLSWPPLHIIAQEGLVTVYNLVSSLHKKSSILQNNGIEQQNFASTFKSIDVGTVESIDYYGSTALKVAAINGRQVMVKALLESGAAIEAQDNGGWTALHCAASNGHKDTVMALLESGADVNARNNYGWTALNSAAWNGHKDIAVALLENDADVNAQDNYGRTALDSAVLNGHKDAVLALLNYSVDVNAQDSKGWTALHTAASKGHKDILMALLKANADTKVQDSDGWTAWHRAALNGHNTVMAFLESGADVKARDNEGWTVLHHAASRGHRNTVMALLKGGADINAQDNYGWTALHRAASNGEGHSTVIALLKNKADIKAQDNQGWTALHRAASVGNKDTVMTLLEGGADVKAQDNDGLTAWHHAAFNGYISIMALFERGVDVKVHDNDGWTALHRAAFHGLKNTVMALLENGADINAQDNEGWTALHRAAWNGKEDAVMTLLENDADVKAQDSEGFTVLHRAASEGHKDIVMMLLNGGADIKAKDNYGWTALHRAAFHRKGHSTVIALLENGADVTAQDNEGWTALHRAASNGRKDAVIALLYPEFKLSEPLINSTILNVQLPTESPLSFGGVDNQIELLSKLASLYPSDHIYPWLLGNSLWEERHYSEAIASYESSIHLDPSNATVTRIGEINHIGVICDCCGQRIIGIWYRCTECKDFDLCSACYFQSVPLEHSSQSNHEFFTIPGDDWKPSSVISDNRSSKNLLES